MKRLFILAAIVFVHSLFAFDGTPFSVKSMTIDLGEVRSYAVIPSSVTVRLNNGNLSEIEIVVKGSTVSIPKVWFTNLRTTGNLTSLSVLGGTRGSYLIMLDYFSSTKAVNKFRPDTVMFCLKGSDVIHRVDHMNHEEHDWRTNSWRLVNDELIMDEEPEFKGSTGLDFEFAPEAFKPDEGEKAGSVKEDGEKDDD